MPRPPNLAAAARAAEVEAAVRRRHGQRDADLAARIDALYRIDVPVQMEPDPAPAAPEVAMDPPWADAVPRGFRAQAWRPANPDQFGQAMQAFVAWDPPRAAEPAIRFFNAADPFGDDPVYPLWREIVDLNEMACTGDVVCRQGIDPSTIPTGDQYTSDRFYRGRCLGYVATPNAASYDWSHLTIFYIDDLGRRRRGKIWRSTAVMKPKMNAKFAQPLPLP